MRRAFTLVELLICVAIVVILAAILFPVFGRAPNHGGRGPACRANLKQISLGFLQYLQDNNEQHPSLETVAGWRDAVRPYIKDSSTFQCPSVENKSDQSSDYWFNARLSSVREEVLDAQALTVMLGDGYSSGDPRVSLSQMPKSWLADEKSPAKRHLDGANYAFADGHVKWLKPEKITSAAPKNGNATFAIR